MIPQQQRSPAWFKWRQSRIGASDAAIILGVNNFKSIGQLLDEKLGTRPPEEENAAMKRGNDYEEKARLAFENETGHVVFPQVCVHPEYDWMVASLDGMTIEKDIVVEIKCPGMMVAHETFKFRKIPEYYIPQLQHQMAVTGVDKIYYYSFFEGGGACEKFTCLITCERDQSFIDNMIEKEKQFYNLLIQGKGLLECFESDVERLKDQVYKILEVKE